MELTNAWKEHQIERALFETYQEIRLIDKAIEKKGNRYLKISVTVFDDNGEESEMVISHDESYTEKMLKYLLSQKQKEVEMLHTWRMQHIEQPL